VHSRDEMRDVIGLGLVFIFMLTGRRLFWDPLKDLAGDAKVHERIVEEDLLRNVDGGVGDDGDDEYGFRREAVVNLLLNELNTDLAKLGNGGGGGGGGGGGESPVAMYREAVRARDRENLGKLALGAARKGVLQIFQNAERALEDAGAPKWLCSRSGVLRQCLRADPQQRPKLKSLLVTLSSTLRSVRSHNYVPLMWVRKPSGQLLRVHSSDKKRLDAAKRERLEVETATPTFTWFRQPPGQGEPARLKQLEAVEVAFAALEASPRPVVEVLDAPEPDAAAGVATLALSGSPVAATRSGSTSTKRVGKSSSKGDMTRTLSGRFNAAEAQLAADEEGPAPPRSSGRKSRGVSQQEDKNLQDSARFDCKARAVLLRFFKAHARAQAKQRRREHKLKNQGGGGGGGSEPPAALRLRGGGAAAGGDSDGGSGSDSSPPSSAPLSRSPPFAPRKVFCWTCLCEGCEYPFNEGDACQWCREPKGAAELAELLLEDYDEEGGAATSGLSPLVEVDDAGTFPTSAPPAEGEARATPAPAAPVPAAPVPVALMPATPVLAAPKLAAPWLAAPMPAAPVPAAPVPAAPVPAVTRTSELPASRCAVA
jgi:hypothetical protein